MSARRPPGIRTRLILSFLLVIVAPVLVSLVALQVALLVLIPGAEEISVQNVDRYVNERIVPDVVDKLQMEAIYSLLDAGQSGMLMELEKQAAALLVDIAGTADIVRSDGVPLFSMGPKGTRIEKGTLVPRIETMPFTGESVAKPLPPGKVLGKMVPGLSLLGSDRARYAWQIASTKASDPVYAVLTFEIPGGMRSVATVSGKYTAVAVLAGILTFALLVVILSWRMSRSILVPLRTFAGAAENIASGNLDIPVSYERVDEFGRLAAVLEDMRVRLRESLLRLQRADSDRKQLVASVTHDLKTPLTSIRGYVEGLRDGVADNPAARDRYFAVILDKTAQLEGLIDGLFRISRLELNDAELRLRPVSSRSLLAGIFDRTRRDVEAAGLVFVLDEPVPERTVHADADAMAQVIDNLVQNAKRYAPAGGTIRASAADRASTLEVSIADNGRGIAPEDLPHVFDLFYRGDPARSGSGGEAGLGLAICKRIVERHGGTIRAENRGGAVVTFTLPVG